MEPVVDYVDGKSLISTSSPIFVIIIIINFIE